MSRITEALDKMATQKYLQGWNNPSIKQFITTGNPALLKSIPVLANGGVWELRSAMPQADAWSDEASRVVQLAVAKGLDHLLLDVIAPAARYSSARWELFDPTVALLRANGVDELKLRQLLFECNNWDLVELKPTQAGEIVLQASDAEFVKAFNLGFSQQFGLVALLAHSQPDRLEKIISDGVKFRCVASAHLAMVQANPERFAAKAFAIFKGLQEAHERVNLISALADADPVKFRETANAEVRQVLSRDGVEDHVKQGCVEYALKQQLPDALDRACQWMADYDKPNPWNVPHQREMILKWAVTEAPRFVLPMAQACARCGASNVILLGLSYWKREGIDDSAVLYHTAIQRLLSHADPAAVVSGISEARGWSIDRTHEDIWTLLLHKSRPVRGAAARALAGLGFAQAGDRAAKLLSHKKADVRQAAVLLLRKLGDAPSADLLEQRLDTEENDDVRDDILLALEASGKGTTLLPEEQQARMAKTLAKAKTPLPNWIKPAELNFKKLSGEALTADEVLYLLVRQSRCKAMRADIEAKPLYAMLDRKQSADAALALLEAFMGSEQDADDRWIMALAALTGDDRLVPILRKAILDWADNSRGKLAEYTVQALALLGTDAALMVVDSLSVRFRSKNKNIGQAAAEAFSAAAETRSVTVEELGDLVVPWLGFEPGKPRLITTPKTQVEARIDAQLKLGFRDTKTGKWMSKLPAGVPAEVQAEFKVLVGTTKEAVKAQLLRIETLLVRQFRWPVDRWRASYLAHPLLRPFTEILIWGSRDAEGKLLFSFRSLGDGSLTNHHDNVVTLAAGGSVSLIHPLDLAESERAAWIEHLFDYEIIPPFPQLERPVVRAEPEQAATKIGKQLTGMTLNAMTFRSRAEKLGWVRGSVCDGGGVTAYRKVFSGAGVEAFLNVEGMYIGIGIDETITLGDLCFVNSGSVKVGSYVYDEPSGENDPRLIAFGDVPPVPFSEIMGDLGKISGKNTAASE